MISCHSSKVVPVIHRKWFRSFIGSGSGHSSEVAGCYGILTDILRKLLYSPYEVRETPWPVSWISRQLLNKMIMENAVLDAIKGRRSIRKYKAEQITDDELQTVLEAGTYAPTGKNLQSPFIVAVQSPELVGRLVRMNAEIMGKEGNPYYGAPTIVLVFVPLPEINKNAVQDGSLVLGTMMLAAHSIGLASCWINREREMFSTPAGQSLMRELGVPEGYMGIGALSLGYSSIPLPKPLPRKENYYKVVK